ncbi:MAG TPA: homoserine O-acetyltransferase [Mycobacteriales bacterium]|nr:homoserine O-acetyltransferase [Mycobacteriales bacterium]
MTGPALLDRAGGWRDGDPVGARRFLEVGAQDLERGGHLPAVRVAYETWGTPRVEGGEVTNAVLVLHALTGDSHVAGPAGPGHPTAGWWDPLIGPEALDPDRWWVVAPNVLGGCQGTTGPGSPAPDGRAWGGRWPALTVRDQVETERRVADLLGVRRWALVVGGSMGGYRGLEWAVTHPDRVARLAAIATTAAASADQIGVQSAQLLAVTSDPGWQGGDYDRDTPGPRTGLGIARRMAHLTYRSAYELETRFGRQPQDGEDPLAGGRFAVQSYLDHQADKLARRFDAGSYVTLTEAMNTHDLGRGRGGVEAALGRVRARTAVVAVDSDRLYPPEQQRRIAAGIPAALPLTVVASPYGHDGFLLETEAVAGALRALLAT